MTTPPTTDPADDFGPYPRCVRLTTERDARYLVITGLAWLGGRRTRIRLATWLIEHTEVSLYECWRMPDGLRAYVTAARQ